MMCKIRPWRHALWGAAGLILLPAAAAAQEVVFELQLVHSSDNESSFMDPATLAPKLLNYAAIVAGLRRLAPDGHHLHLTAGDHSLPGPFHEAAAEVESLGAPGLADVAAFNAMGLAANGIGNHEFDGGLDYFATMLAAADYPFIAVNLDFSNAKTSKGAPPIRLGIDGASVEANAGRAVRSAYVEVGGERIGLIGRAPADLFNVVDDPSETLPGVDFIGGRNPADNQPLVSAVEQVNAQVALLEEQGINKIILLDHAQDFTADPLAANALAGIDVIVTAGSTGFMGRDKADGPFNLLRAGDKPIGQYPVMQTNAAGDPVAVVNSDQLYRYVGHATLGFDAAGRIVEVDERSGPIATTEAGVAAVAAVVGQDLAPPDAIRTLYDRLQATPLIKGLARVVGTTAQPLNGERADVRGRETNLGRVASDSTLWYARTFAPDRKIDIALKNGGGLRASISAPKITGFTVAAALAFDNKVAILDLTAAQLLAVLENAVSRMPAADGRFPQLAGARLSYDASREGISDALTLDRPSRIRSLIVTRADGSEDVLVEDGTAQGDLARTFTLATNNFLVSGGDGFRALAAAAESDAGNLITTEIGERQVLVDYLADQASGGLDVADPPTDPRVVRLDRKG